MGEPQKKNQAHVDEHDGIDLRGALFGVGVVGFVIIIMWFGVWSLFLSR